MCISKNCLLSLASCLVAVCSAQNAAAANLIINGDFSSTTGDIINQQIGVGNSSVAGGVVALVNGWISGKATPTLGGIPGTSTTADLLTPTVNYNFIYGPGDAGTIGALTKYSTADAPNDPTKRVILCTDLNSPTGSGASAIPASSPSGGNFVALDGSFETGPLSQQLTGLTIGNQYDLSFYWASAQQTGFPAPGGLTERLQVSLGGQKITTNTVTYPEYNYVDWAKVTMTFTADAVNPVLSFLSVGTPDGQPPFALLDGVSLEAVPEPSSCFIGALSLAGLLLRRRRHAVTA
jgi:MYXO-CTERM domain-containing protein